MGRDWIQQYVNRDEAELNGVEATVDFTVGAVDVGMNYTYSDSKITKGPGKGERFNDLPMHVANLSLDWQTTDMLSVWGNAQHRSATRDEAAASGHIGEHTIFDAGMDHDFTQTVTGSVGLYNIGDKVFENGYSDGRRLYVGLTTTF